MANDEQEKASLLVRVFNGARQLIDPTVNLLITIRDGDQKELYRDYYHGPKVRFPVPFSNNLADKCTVIVYADGYKQAGFMPVKVSLTVERVVDLMLLPEHAKINFDYPSLAALNQTNPKLVKLLSHGAADEAAAENRYAQLAQNDPTALAALLNITTAMQQVHLSEGTPLDYLIELFWDDSMAQDRFFAWADAGLINQVKLAAEQGEFAPEHGAAFFHTGATLSYKQIQFGEANVQLSFHENDIREIDGVQCVKVEPDIDYYKDIGGHALLEVVPNHITGGLTDPEQVYVLRWIAGQQAGLPQFDPLYTIV